MKRKILFLVLGAIMIWSFAACENEEKTSESAHSDVTSETSVSTVSEESAQSEEVSEIERSEAEASMTDEEIILEVSKNGRIIECERYADWLWDSILSEGRVDFVSDLKYALEEFENKDIF